MGGLAMAPIGGVRAPTLPVGATHADAMRHNADSAGRPSQGAHVGHSPAAARPAVKRDSAAPHPLSRDSSVHHGVVRDSVGPDSIVRDSAMGARAVRDRVRRRDAMEPPGDSMVSFTPPSATPRRVGTSEPDTATWAATGQSQRLRELYLRMMADTVIRRRVLADSALRRLFVQSLEDLPREDRARLDRMLREAQVPGEGTRPSRPPPGPPPARPSTPPSKPPTD